MSQTILLTGGAGNLGRMLSNELAERGDEALRLDIRKPGDDHGQYIEGSILDRATLVIHLASVDSVVHIAAWHGVHEARGWKSQDEFWELNVTGTYNVFQACVEADVHNVVYISSSSVADKQGFYSFTKKLGEAVAQDYAQRHGLNVIILRPRAFIPHWNRQVYASFLEWAQWFWTGAVHIDDVTQAVMQSIDLLNKGELEEALTLNVDGAYEYRDEDLADWDQDGAGMTFRKYYQEYEEVARKFGLDPAKQPTKMDIAETRKLLGYEPRYSLKNLLEELAQYGEEGPPGPKF